MARILGAARSGLALDGRLVRKTGDDGCPVSRTRVSLFCLAERSTLVGSYRRGGGTNGCRGCFGRFPRNGCLMGLVGRCGRLLCSGIGQTPARAGFGGFFSGVALGHCFGKVSNHGCAPRMHSLCSSCLFSVVRRTKTPMSGGRYVDSCRGTSCLRRNRRGCVSTLRCVGSDISCRLVGPRIGDGDGLELIQSFLAARGCERFHSGTRSLYGRFRSSIV